MLQICTGIHITYPLLSDFHASWIFSKDSREIRKHQIARKSAQWEPSRSMQTGRHDGGRCPQICESAPKKTKLRPVNGQWLKLYVSVKHFQYSKYKDTKTVTNSTQQTLSWDMSRTSANRFPAFLKTRNIVTVSQFPAICAYPEPYEYNPRPRNLFLQCPI